MGKGLNSKARNKQEDLLKKVELARQQQQQQQNDEHHDDSSCSDKDGMNGTLTDAEIKKRNDQLRFEELLSNQGSFTILNTYSKDGYLTKQQEEDEIDAVRAGVERLFEGDLAPIQPFENLVHVTTTTTTTGNTLDGGKESIAYPCWKNENDFLIVLCDPRLKSVELRTTCQTLSATLPTNVRSKLIVINADSPAENKRWLKKSSVNLEIYSDEQREWMKAYTALGQKRLSMTMFIIAKERIQKLAREVDGDFASRTILNAVKTLDI